MLVSLMITCTFLWFLAAVTAPENQNKLFLLVSDECEWGATREKGSDRFLNDPALTGPMPACRRSAACVLGRDWKRQAVDSLIY